MNYNFVERVQKFKMEVTHQDFLNAIIQGKWTRFVNLCKAHPHLIITPFCGRATFLHYACRYCDVRCLRILSHILLENGISVDFTRHYPCAMDKRKMKVFVCAVDVVAAFDFMDKRKMEVMKVLVEFGSEYEDSPLDDGPTYYIYCDYEYLYLDDILDKCYKEVQQKWSRCAHAAAALLLTRRRRHATTWFHLIGHDMTRVIAQEVWAHKRHEAWE